MIQETNGHPQLQMIPLDHIVPWQAGQMRKNFDPVKLQELADSIEEKGVLQPVLVRPYWDDEDDGGSPPFFELVAGERRWRASKLAKQAAIPAIVRQLTDKEAVEVQVVENLQRTDLSAVEEAEGYKRLLEEHGYTADSLAGKLAKSKSYVYGRLKLGKLPDVAMTALAKGDLPATVGELIGRLPSMEMREQFWGEEFEGYGEEYFEMPSFRDVKESIEHRYMRELKGAPFSQTDKKLVPAAGDCKNCPKRTGNNRGDFPDGRADICTDIGCFKLKVEASGKRQLETAAADGAKVLTDKESKQWFNTFRHALAWDKREEYVDLSAECEELWDDDDDSETDDDKPPAGPRTYGELLGAIKPDVIGVDPNGDVRRLVSKPRAAEILRNKHGIEIEEESRNVPQQWQVKVDPQVLKQREEDELKRKARGVAFERIAEKVAAWYDAEFINRFKAGYGSKSTLPDLLRTVAHVLLRNFDDWAPVSDTLKRRDALNTTDEVDNSDEFDQVVARLLKDADAADLIGILAEVCVREELHYVTRGYDRERCENTICDFAGLKIDEFEKQALKDLKPEKNAKKQTPREKLKAI